MQKENRSEVAQMMEEIELGYAACRVALHGFAEGASHEHITKRMEGIWDDIERLETIGGKEAAKAFLMKL